MTAPALRRYGALTTVRAPRRLVALSLAFSLFAFSLFACSDEPAGPTPQPPPPATIATLSPTILVVGSTLAVEAKGFSLQASHELEIATATGTSVSLRLAAAESRLSTTLDASSFQTLGAGPKTVSVRLRSRNEWGETRGPPAVFDIELAESLSPSLVAVGDGLVHINSEVTLEGAALLLGGDEGYSEVELAGCFLPMGLSEPCTLNGQVVKYAVRLSSVEASRQRGTFPYPPELAGIAPGTFSGDLTIINRQLGKTSQRGTRRPVRFEVQLPMLTGASDEGVSLGQYVEVRGKGFVGGTNGSTLLEFDGTFTPKGESARPVKLSLVTGFVDGGTLRYVLEEENGVGAVVDLRKETGVLSGTWQPIVSFGSEEQRGAKAELAVEIGAVKQVVHLRFLPSWQEALRAFGLQPADRLVRDRVLVVLRRAYEGINVEVREEQPKDFGLYATVDIGGPDPNALGLLGYDNTPGKDVENKRLFDHVGGVNALTQEDGYPGYGGIFALSQLGFSEHPPKGVKRSSLHTPLFDQIFDPVRPDKGQEVTSSEVAAAPKLDLPQGCPASERSKRVACAILVLGNLIGHTAAHELGHSFGLAEPYGAPTTYHNPGDIPNRLMEGGSGRPFAERAELQGQGPAVFCDDEFAYLQLLMPGQKPDPLAARPTCY